MRLRSIIYRYSFVHLLALTLALALLLTGCTADTNAGLRAKEASKGLDHYDYQLVFRPEENTLALTMTLDMTNRTPDTLTSLVLRTWAGAYKDEASSPAAIEEVYDACYIEGFSTGGIRIDGAWWNDVFVSAAFTDDADTVLRVDIPDLAVNAQGTLRLRATLTIPHCAHRFGYARGVWQFGNALPILSVYEDGAWRTDAYHPIGDPFVSACANYDVTLVVPEGFQCAASGTVASTTKDGQTTFGIAVPASRDFAFALSKDWQTASVRQNGVTVTAFAADEKGARRAARNAAKALKVYGELYGAYPYEALTLCAVEFPFGGMEYPGLIFLGSGYFYEDWKDTLELTIAHEVAHQWFYALAGSDQFNHPWQDEALSEYAMLCYAQEVYGQSAYENLLVTRVNAPMQERIAAHLTPGSPIDYFASFNDYTSVVYGRGAALMIAINDMTGKADAFLKAYCDAFAFKIASRADFEQTLLLVTGEDLTPLLIDYLDTLI